MRNIFSKVLSIVATFAVCAVTANVNSACCLILYEPEMPDTAKKLIR